MVAVAVGTGRGLVVTGCDGLTVNTVHVGLRRSRAVSTAGHDVAISVAGGAGRGDVGVIGFGFWIGRRKYLVRTAVTGDACGGLRVSVLDGLSVEAMVIGLLRVLVAGCTLGLGRRGFMRPGPLDTSVAVGTREHAAVNGGLVDILLDGIVTRDAIRRRHRRRSGCEGRTDEKNENDSDQYLAISNQGRPPAWGQVPGMRTTAREEKSLINSSVALKPDTSTNARSRADL